MATRLLTSQQVSTMVQGPAPIASSAMSNIAAVLSAKLAPPPAPAPVAPAPVATAAPAPVAVATRGGMVIKTIKLGGKRYRVSAAHNVAWWAIITKAMSEGQGKASVEPLVKAGIPSTHFSYLVRRGYLVSAE